MTFSIFTYYIGRKVLILYELEKEEEICAQIAHATQNSKENSNMQIMHITKEYLKNEATCRNFRQVCLYGSRIQL